jgi:outer membrane lipoprotein SlyB
MIATRMRPLLLPLVLAAGLGACASNAVQPGIVSSSAPVYGSPSNVPPPGAPTQVAYSTPVGGPGRVVSIREVGLAGGGGGSGGGNGALMGGIIGGGVGATIGAITSQTVGGGLVGLLLGTVGGAIAGTIADGQRSGGRGIEVTVQRDDGQSVTVAQRDDGDVQLGDRVQVVQDGRGAARVVRDTSRSPD